jgi:hypothetical protein
VFEAEDVRELFGVLVGDARLGPSVRCAAADQLCVCAADERLEDELVRPAHLASVARLAASAATSEGPDLDVASACLKLLAAVTSRSRRARAFFADAAPAVELDYDESASSNPPTPYGRAARLFPLAFHPQAERPRTLRGVRGVRRVRCRLGPGGGADWRPRGDRLCSKRVVREIGGVGVAVGAY